MTNAPSAAERQEIWDKRQDDAVLFGRGPVGLGETAYMKARLAGRPVQEAQAKQAFFGAAQDAITAGYIGPRSVKFSVGPMARGAPVETVPARAGPVVVGQAVRPGQAASYGELKAQKARFGETEPLDMDHQPSFAAQVVARQALLGRELSKVELARLKASTPAVASPRKIHQQTSPTYGGRNTPEQIANDAANRPAAQARDRAVFDKALRQRK